ncbi:NfeD family protein [Zavarzinella formosa]|uniref:NfeD family protein n=1 Tax=Zavarzinella formosa TaxID=360055 RepID=UPI0002FF256D|nr:NfeD family protein [Zavarzinella formosa]
MNTVFLICAGIGVTLIVCQFLMSLLGFGADHHGLGDQTSLHDSSHGDHDAAHDNNWFIGLLTFKTVSTAITFFGLGGLSAQYYDLPTASIIITAILSGLSAFYVVAMLMRSLSKLKSAGNVNVDSSLGQPGTVYLRIPGFKEGAGKVTLNLQNRTVELEAITFGPELPTGSPITVREVMESGVVEVAARGT